LFIYFLLFFTNFEKKSNQQPTLVFPCSLSTLGSHQNYKFWFLLENNSCKHHLTHFQQFHFSNMLFILSSLKDDWQAWKRASYIKGQLPSVKVEHVEHKRVKSKNRVCEDRERVEHKRVGSKSRVCGRLVFKSES
jgi:hypothetical protein